MFLEILCNAYWISLGCLICPGCYWETGFVKVIANCNLFRDQTNLDDSSEIRFGFLKGSCQIWICIFFVDSIVTLYWKAPISDILELAFLNTWGRNVALKPKKCLPLVIIWNQLASPLAQGWLERPEEGPSCRWLRWRWRWWGQGQDDEMEVNMRTGATSTLTSIFR